MKSTFWFLIGLVASLFVMRAGESQSWQYQLIEGSDLVDECLICGRPTIQWPMRGSFQLRTLEATPIRTRYALENINFHAGAAGNEYFFTGSGTLELSGQLAVRQTVRLDGVMKMSSQTNEVHFTNETSSPTRLWPMISATMFQTNGTLVQTFTLQLNAAPLRDIWFSTSSSFHRSDTPVEDSEVSSGDLLSMEGRVVKRNSELQEKFPGPTFANMELDAVDLLPGAEIAFSTDTLGVLNDGDFAFLRSGQILRFGDFMAPWNPPKEPGLDALHFTSTNRFYFSVEHDFAASASSMVQHGDILFRDLATEDATIFKKNRDLLARFHPALQDKDYGLDALFIWPSGEIWFSTTDGFSDAELGDVGAGDILSDQGYVVFRNLELVSEFKPIEDVSNFGLDALVIISDVAEILPGPKIEVTANAPNSVLLTWKGSGRVFQVERADDVTGPFLSVTPIFSDLHWEDAKVSEKSSRFYRLRQW
jgi:hypothetical protein